MTEEQLTEKFKAIMTRAGQRQHTINNARTLLEKLNKERQNIAFAITELTGKVFLSDLQGIMLVVNKPPINTSTCNILMLPESAAADLKQTIKDVQTIHSNIVVNKLRDSLGKINEAIAVELQSLECLLK